MTGEPSLGWGRVVSEDFTGPLGPTQPAPQPPHSRETAAELRQLFPTPVPTVTIKVVKACAGRGGGGEGVQGWVRAGT